jgi:uncharacterized secreted protein with C-terminal beta-propeller domain
MRRFAVAMAVGSVLLAACTSGQAVVEQNGGTTPRVPVQPQFQVTGGLAPFDACDDLLGWITGHAVDLVGPYGFDGGYGYMARDEVFFGDAENIGGRLDAAAESAPQATTTVPAFGDDFTSTNVQELGIDEPDIVKTDGERIIVVSGSQLHVVTIDNGRLTLAGTVDLGFWTQDLFLTGDRVIAVSNAWDDWGGPMPLAETGADAIWYPSQAIVTVTEVDITDPGDPTLTSTLRIDGNYVSARMVHDRVRLVISAGPTGFAWTYPEGSGLRAERDAEAANRELVEESTIENWLPYYVLSDVDGVDRVVDEGVLVGCSRTHHPDEFSGLNTLSLVTLGDESLAIEDATAVFADGQIVYSSADSTYVATTTWLDPVVLERQGLPDEAATMIHRFALTEHRAGYRASGAVTGYMLSQWSMSEWDGHLRVATTSSPVWWGDDTSESAVTVLAEEDGELLTVGRVDGLGEGEQIYAVRFINDRGYVVTFRQVDPLYVLDLSDPERPTVEGELKIPGYSAYLHPVDDGYLMGVGQDADLDGRTSGTQVSLFDVRDPGEPNRVDRLTIGGASSEVEWDHHAFLHHAPSGLTVFPYQRWSWEDDGQGDVVGALVLTVTEHGIAERGTVSHGDSSWESMPIRRAMLINGDLVTVSDAGVMVSDSASLERVAWVAFPGYEDVFRK